jgi:hypothetical protein
MPTHFSTQSLHPVASAKRGSTPRSRNRGLPFQGFRLRMFRGKHPRAEPRDQDSVPEWPLRSALESVLGDARATAA